MKFDARKIDERIKKLQELQRLMSDPEMWSILAEFVSEAEESRAARPTLPPPPVPTEVPGPEVATAATQVANDVVNGETAFGALWNNRRGR